MLSPRIVTRAIRPVEVMSASVRPFSSLASGAPPPVRGSACEAVDNSPSGRMERTERIIDYHEVSKHHLDRYARGPGSLDWANQPIPFRQFTGAKVFDLDLAEQDGAAPSIAYDQLFAPSAGKPAEVSFRTISQLLRDSLALSAWKSRGSSKWSLRCNPSSGNLHPTEGYLILDAMPGLNDSAGVYHYRPKDHALELRSAFPSKLLQDILGDAGGFFVGLSSVHWREAWKYGERAFRYCQHDVGHAIEAVTIAAGGLEWTTHVLDDVITSHELQALLGLRNQVVHASHEEPDCLLYVRPMQNNDKDVEFASTKLESLISHLAREENEWMGKANRLGAREVLWTRIEEANDASKKYGPNKTQLLKPWSKYIGLKSDRSPVPPLRQIIHQRRSAVDFDPDHEFDMRTESFYNILRAVQAPFASLPWDPQVHLVLFVHSVEDMDPGLYILIRNHEHLEELKAGIDNEYLWLRPENCPQDIQLYQIASGDTRHVAKTISCHQDIASDGSFSLGMITRFEDTLKDKGAWFYRRLFWECGMIGQRLYISAEAAHGGFRGTGIGCFFDDVMHSVLGFRDMKYQSLYHFTVGFPITDSRIMHLDPYHHLPEDRRHPPSSKGPA